MRPRPSTLVASLATVALGCAHETTPAVHTTTTVAAAPQPAAGGITERGPTARPMNPIPAPAVAEAATPPPAPALDVGVLDDQEILNLTHVANQNEILAAQLAEKRASDPEVRALARKIERDHENAEKQTERVAAVSKLTPQSSEAASRLQAAQRETMLQLVNKSGKDFDRAFVDATVDSQRDVLQLIDVRMAPDATTDEVKAMVQQLRPQVARHYEEARALQQKLKGD